MKEIAELAAQVRQLVSGKPACERASYVEMVARQFGYPELADKIAGWAAGGPWSVPWAQWQDFHGYLLSGLRLGRVDEFATARIDGKPMIISGGYDHNLRVWDLQTGHQVGRSLSGHNQVVKAVAVGCIGGKQIAVSGSADGTVRVWDIESCEQIGAALSGHGDASVEAVAVTYIHDRPVALSCGWDRTVRRWCLETGQPIGDPLTGHTESVHSVAAGQLNGRPIAVSGGADHTVRVWDLETGRQVGVPLTGHEKLVIRVAVGQLNGRPIAVSGGADHTVRVWDLETGRQVGNTFIHDDSQPDRSDEVCGVALAETGGRPMLISSGWAGITRAWRLDTGELVGLHATGFDRTTDMKVIDLDDHCVVAVANRDGRLGLWNIGPSADLSHEDSSWDRWADAVLTVPFENTTVAASTGPGGVIRVFDMYNGRQISDPLRALKLDLNDLADVEAAGRHVIISGGYDGALRTWFPGGARRQGQPVCLCLDTTYALATAFLPGGPVLVSGHDGGEIQLHDISGQELRPAIKAHGISVRSLAAGQLNGNAVALSAGADRKVRAWNLVGRTLVWVHDRDSWGLALYPLGGKLAAWAGGEDGSITVWDFETGSPIGAVRGHDRACRALTIAEHDEAAVLLSGGEDGTVRVWGIPALDCRAVIDVNSAVYSLASASSGAVLVGQRMGVMVIDVGGILSPPRKLRQPHITRDHGAPPEGTSAQQRAAMLASRGALFAKVGSYHPAMHEEAIACCDEALQIEPGHVQALRQRGASRRALDYGGELALRDLSRVLEIDPKDVTARAERGDILRVQGRLDECLADLDQALALAPGNVFARLARGRAHEEAYDFEKALADYDKAVSGNPTWPLTLECRGRAYFNLHRYTDALADLDRAISLDSRSVNARRCRGLVYRYVGRFEDALAEFDQVLDSENPPSVHTIFGKAHTLVHTGRRAEAEVIFNAALDKFPDSGVLYFHFGVFLSRQARYEEARRAFESARGKSGWKARWIASVAELLMRQGQYPAALQACEEALAANAADHESLVNYGHTLICLGRPVDALTYLRQAIAVRDSREALVLAGAVLWNRGDPSGARAYFTRAREVGDSCTYFRLNELLAIAHAGLGEPGLAVYSLRAAASRRLPGDVAQPALYDLLAGPPLAGIGQLRQIALADPARPGA